MQIESLKVFCDLVATESFTKAAQVNGVTRSAVSQTVSAMERHFKSLLVERSKKHFQLTPEGKALHERAKSIVGQFESIHHQMEAIKGIVAGNLHVSAIYSIGLHVLPPYLKKFLKVCPTVRVDVQYRQARQIYGNVLGNEADLGLVAYPTKDMGLEAVPLRKDPMVLICHPKHPFAKLRSVKLKALEGQKLVSFDPEIPTRKALDKLFRQQGVSVKHALEFDNVETVKRAVEIDAGVALVPLVTVTEEVAKRTLVAVKIEGREVSRPLALIYKKNKVLSPAMKEFIAVLKGSL